MRTPGLSALVIFVSVALGAEAEDADSLYRPQARVEDDPPSYYSVVLHRERGKPQKGEWRYTEKARVQPFQKYVSSKPHRPTKARHTIHICPIGRLNAKDRFRMETIRLFLQIYFALPVKIMPVASLEDIPSSLVTTPGGQFPQYSVYDIKERILEPRLQDDALGMLGITMADVNARKDWRFAFGMAWLKDRLAVYSLARFYPEIWGEPFNRNRDRQGLRRSLRQCAKGVGNILGLQPCHQYYCVMNSSISVREADEIPLHLCAGCLKKLRWNTGFDVIERYETLLRFYTLKLMFDETSWIRKRLEECRKATPP